MTTRRAERKGGERLVSIVIPVRNGAATLEACLRAAFASRRRRFEVVVVDDASDDGSAEIARRFPCTLVRLERHGGVSKARNAGAAASAGELLLFIDADCILGPEALSIADGSYGAREDLVLGGTYTPVPWDRDFFSLFQSVAIHHFETKRDPPDYVAAHAMAIDAGLFRRCGGFVEGSFLGVAAAVEDVELSHRLRRAGCELAMEPRLQVQHVFRFSLRRSLANAARKARYWTTYSMSRGDLFEDSGAASVELKANVLLGLVQAVLLAGAAALRATWPLAAALPLVALNLGMSRRLVAAWARAGGLAFSARATLYYFTLYAGAVAIGAAAGAAQYLWSVRLLRKHPECTARFDTRGLSS
jgi:glycosyltransferase involved in cell wall biosynthesis